MIKDPPNDPNLIEKWLWSLGHLPESSKTLTGLRRDSKGLWFIVQDWAFGIPQKNTLGLVDGPETPIQDSPETPRFTGLLGYLQGHRNALLLRLSFFQWFAEWINASIELVLIKKTIRKVNENVKYSYLNRENSFSLDSQSGNRVITYPPKVKWQKRSSPQGSLNQRSS